MNIDNTVAVPANGHADLLAGQQYRLLPMNVAMAIAIKASLAKFDSTSGPTKPPTVNIFVGTNMVVQDAPVQVQREGGDTSLPAITISALEDFMTETVGAGGAPISITCTNTNAQPVNVRAVVRMRPL